MPKNCRSAVAEKFLMEKTNLIKEIKVFSGDKNDGSQHTEIKLHYSESSTQLRKKCTYSARTTQGKSQGPLHEIY
jgi:hypothetical protein